MKQILLLIGKILAWLIFISAFAAIGLGTESPGLMVPVYALTMIVILGLIYLYSTKHKRHSFEDMKSSSFMPYIIGGGLSLISLFLPAFLMIKYRPGLISFFPIFLITIVMLLLGVAGIWLINCYSKKNKVFAYIGYLVLLATAAIPAIGISGYDNSYSTMGMVYYITLLEAIVAWTGMSALAKKLIKTNE
jgi:hypothetical protein